MTFKKYFFLQQSVSFLWFASCVTETNRVPLNLVEGESVLDSGFNVQYGATGSALILLAEYVNILLMMCLG